MTDNHDVIVKVGLTADQYLWCQHEAEDRGLSQSAFIRTLIQNERRTQALSKLSVSDRYEASPIVGLDRVNKTYGVK